MRDESTAQSARKVYYLNGYVRIEAADDDEAERKFEEVGLGVAVPDPNVEGVTLDFQGPWDEVVELAEPGCICPPDLLARGGFRGGCLVHG